MIGMGVWHLDTTTQKFRHQFHFNRHLDIELFTIASTRLYSMGKDSMIKELYLLIGCGIIFKRRMWIHIIVNLSKLVSCDVLQNISKERI